MIDPATIGLAYAGAKATVAGIKEVIKLGQDIDSIGSKIIQYFTHKGVIEKAEVVKEREQRDAFWKEKNGERTKKSHAQLTAEALDIVMKKRALDRQEYELYQMLVWSGNGDIWHQMVAVREEMRKKILAEEAETVKKQILDAKRARELKEHIKDFLLVAGSVIIVGLIFYGVVQFGISEGLWLAHSRYSR
jgi:hypothetical protein